MGKLKEFRTRIAGKVVTYYRDRIYRKAVKEADARHLLEGETIYVIDHFLRGRTLSCVSRKQFRIIKHSAQKLHKDSIYWSPSYNLNMLKEQCWYHTPDRSGNNGLKQGDAEIRRLAFIRDGLKKARLYKD